MMSLSTVKYSGDTPKTALHSGQLLHFTEWQRRVCVSFLPFFKRSAKCTQRLSLLRKFRFYLFCLFLMFLFKVEQICEQVGGQGSIFSCVRTGSGIAPSSQLVLNVCLLCTRDSTAVLTMVSPNILTTRGQYLHSAPDKRGNALRCSLPSPGMEKAARPSSRGSS